MSILNGPRADAVLGVGDALVILLHGYGANGDDLFGIAQALAPHLPNVIFRSPNAPERCAVNPMGYQWFPISWIDGSPESDMQAGARRAVQTLQDYLNEAAAEEGIAPERTILIGFSQGTMMSIEVGLRREAPLAGIVGFSGRLITTEESGPITSPAPVLLVHGDQDEVVPVEAIHEARAALAEAGIPVKWHVSQGVGHGIAPDGLSLALAFIEDRLG